MCVWQRYCEVVLLQVYAELKHKGVEFPATNLETMAPIITPQRVCGTALEVPFV